MKQYQDLIRTILDTGIRQPNRTGVDTLMIPGAMFQHDMRTGFPAVTHKKLYYAGGVVGELLGFINAFDNTQDFKAFGCNVWDANAGAQAWKDNPAYRGEGDLGRIYGKQWRDYTGYVNGKVAVDQFARAICDILHNPTSRRIIVDAWNPTELNQAALPPCHTMFQFLCDTVNMKLHLCWYQRSVDTFLGLPFNIASYGTLLELVARCTGYTAGTLTGFLADTHLYLNHIEQAEEALSRPLFPLAKFNATPMVSSRTYANCLSYLEGLKPENIWLEDYLCGAPIKAEMTV